MTRTSLDIDGSEIMLRVEVASDVPSVEDSPQGLTHWEAVLWVYDELDEPLLNVRWKDWGHIPDEAQLTLFSHGIYDEERQIDTFTIDVRRPVAEFRVPVSEVQGLPESFAWASTFEYVQTSRETDFFEVHARCPGHHSQHRHFPQPACEQDAVNDLLADAAGVPDVSIASIDCDEQRDTLYAGVAFHTHDTMQQFALLSAIGSSWQVEGIESSIAALQRESGIALGIDTGQLFPMSSSGPPGDSCHESALIETLASEVGSSVTLTEVNCSDQLDVLYAGAQFLNDTTGESVQAILEFSNGTWLVIEEGPEVEGFDLPAFVLRELFPGQFGTGA